MASLEVGIIGLPNVGKTTLFAALTSTPAVTGQAAPSGANVGVAAVPDARLDALAAAAESRRTVYASVQLVDVAGLGRGSARGGGLGPELVGHLRTTDAIVHVVRTFEDPAVFHVDGRIDPVADATVVDLELLLADHAACERRLERVMRLARVGDKDAASEASSLERLVGHLDAGGRARDFGDPLPPGLDLLTAKPLLYVANTGDGGDSEAVAALRAYAGAAPVVPVAAKFEAELNDLDSEAERTAFLADAGLAEPGMPRLARAAFALLDLIYFYTVGPKEARAWPLRRGSSVLEAAAKVHSDIARGFIRAEVISSDDMLEVRTPAEAQRRGLMRIEGRDYTVRPADVINIRFNV